MVVSLSKTSIRVVLAGILILVILGLTGLGIVGAVVFRDRVEKGFEALDKTEEFHDQVIHIRETYEEQIQEWKNLLLRGHEEDSFYLHLSRFYDLERMTISATHTLAEAVADSPSIQTPLDQFLRAHRRLSRKYRAAFRLYNASESDPQFAADKLVAGQDDEPRQLLIGINSALETERQVVRTGVDAFMIFAQKVGLAVALLLMPGAVLLLFWFLNIRLLRPLHQAVSVAEKISGGNLDTPFTFDREDEIGSLLAALKTMQENLVRSRTEATQLTENLEQTVADRTRELTQEIAERERADTALQNLNEKLEQTVLDRTVELRGTQEMLLRKERLSSIGQITATVSHELRNPLGAIRSGIDVIKKFGDEASPHKNRAVALIDRAEKRCNDVITELLDFARVRDLARNVLAVDDWLAMTLDEYALSLSPDVILRRELNAGVSTDFDHERLRRVLVNVLDNACQALGGTDDGDGEARRAEIVVTTQVAGDRLEIIVSDNGPGIAPDDIEQVFEPLYTTKTIGVGLGLPLVRQVMEQHGGGVEIMSEFGQGTKVVLWLPLQSST